MADKIKSYLAGDVKIDINRTQCISCGSCTFIADKTFELDADMIATVKDSGPYNSLNEIKDAAASCPTTAITIEK